MEIGLLSSHVPKCSEKRVIGRYSFSSDIPHIAADCRLLFIMQNIMLNIVDYFHQPLSYPCICESGQHLLKPHGIIPFSVELDQVQLENSSSIKTQNYEFVQKYESGVQNCTSGTIDEAMLLKQ